LLHELVRNFGGFWKGAVEYNAVLPSSTNMVIVFDSCKS
jgi:hypothetical protein